MTAIRIEVEEWHAGRYEAMATTIDTSLLEQLTTAERAQLDEHLTHAVTEMRALGCPDPEFWMAGELTRRLLDARAYDREATRRGVLAL